MEKNLFSKQGCFLANSMAESSLFYDPFANRKEDKLDPFDSLDKFSKDREAKKGGRDSGSVDGGDGDGNESPRDENVRYMAKLFFSPVFFLYRSFLFKVEDFFDDSPSAPPIDILDCIQGYETVSFDATRVPPPPRNLEEEDDQDGGPKEENRKGLLQKIRFGAILLLSCLT